MSGSASPRELDVRLKGLRGRDRELEVQAEQARRDLARLESERRQVRQQVEALESKRRDPIVTEHALLRYLERVCGVDVEAARQAILTPKLREQIAALQSGVFPADGFRVRARNGAVVTVIVRDEERD
jgi:chromosome segregation ATPase